MAKLGFRTVEEMVGRSDRLDKTTAVDHYKTKGLDFRAIFHQPEVGENVGRFCQVAQDHGLEKALDVTTLLPVCWPAIERGERHAIHRIVFEHERVRRRRALRLADLFLVELGDPILEADRFVRVVAHLALASEDTEELLPVLRLLVEDVETRERLEVIGLGATTGVLLIGSFVAVGRRRPRP